MSDLEHDYDELWQIIAGDSHYGVEHHDVEIYDYHNPAHDLDHLLIHDHELHHNDAHYEHGGHHNPHHYRDYNHDVYSHHGQELLSDVNHEYDSLWHMIEDATAHGVEHHDFESIEHHTPDHYYHEVFDDNHHPVHGHD